MNIISSSSSSLLSSSFLRETFFLSYGLRFCGLLIQLNFSNEKKKKHTKCTMNANKSKEFVPVFPLIYLFTSLKSEKWKRAARIHFLSNKPHTLYHRGKEKSHYLYILWLYYLCWLHALLCSIRCVFVRSLNIVRNTLTFLCDRYVFSVTMKTATTTKTSLKYYKSLEKEFMEKVSANSEKCEFA